MMMMMMMLLSLVDSYDSVKNELTYSVGQTRPVRLEKVKKKLNHY